jgi:hypothetical protein
MNNGDSSFSHLSTPSTYSVVWAQFQAKTDTKDTKHRSSIEIPPRHTRAKKPRYAVFSLGTETFSRPNKGILIDI